MTIKELNDGIEKMREVYPFKDSKTKININSDARAIRQTIECMTYDDDYEISITLRGFVDVDRTRGSKQ